MSKPQLIKRFALILEWIIRILGILFLILLILSFTSLPFWGYYWLGTSESKRIGKPEYIVLLGGGGMPSESNLMRAFFVNKAARELPASKVIISIPGDTADQQGTARQVAQQLVRDGLESDRIMYENIGTNTRSQALELQNFHQLQLTGKPVLLVTSPEHMRRAVLTFRKAGFLNVNALPAFENALEADLAFNDEELGGSKKFVPDIGNNISVRYQFWNHLKYEILIAREMAALGYYKLRGWI